MGDEILAPMQYTGSTNAELFETWFEQVLLPCLPKDTVIVMDNASFHRKKQLFEIVDRSGFITSACKDRKHIGTKRNVKLEQDHVSSSAIFLSFSAEVIF